MALIVDDILLFPYRGIKWIFKEIARIAEEEVEGESERITQQLSELYMLLETEQITAEEFESREKVLLDRLDQIQDEREGEEVPERLDREAETGEDEEWEWDEWDELQEWDGFREEDEAGEEPDGENP